MGNQTIRIIIDGGSKLNANDIVNGWTGTKSNKKPNALARASDEQKASNKVLSKKIQAFSDPVSAGTDKIAGKLSPAAAYATTAGVNLAVGIVKQSINYYVSNIGRANGDSNYQAQVNRQMEIVNDFLNTGSSVLGGASAGAMVGGPAGALVGAAIGGISSAVSIGFRQAEREREYQHTQFENANSQAYNLARANYSATTGRLR
jgi:hypothetical protein